jgi:hypothetical protein
MKHLTARSHLRARCWTIGAMSILLVSVLPVICHNLRREGSDCFS